MSSRALRRIQKEKLFLQEEPSDEEASDHEPAPATAINPFDLLNNGDDDDQDDNDDTHTQEPAVSPKDDDQDALTPSMTPVKKKKKKAKKTGLPPMDDQPAPSNSKKSKKKNKKKTTQVDDMSMQDLDALLENMNQETPNTTSSQDQPVNPQHALSRPAQALLSIQARYLDPEAEMKRLFGSRIVNREARPSGKLLKKTKLATPKADWPMYHKQGLTMKRWAPPLDGDNNDDDSSGDGDDTSNTDLDSFTFDHQGSYQDIQLAYAGAIERMDPNTLVMLSRQHPYHIDTLLQLSEIAKQQGDWTVAGDCIDRALYASERALHPHCLLGPGTARLPFQRSENRSFYSALVRHVQFLTRRGCWRTAFEFNKLLFSLSPLDDPTGSLLTMDYHALCAHEYQYVVDLVTHWQADGNVYPRDLHSLPNLAYSSAYALYKLDQVDLAADALKQAITLFPGVASALLEKLDVSAKVDTSPIDEYLQLLTAMYVDRCHQLWKEPEVLSWLSETVAGVKDSSRALHALPIDWEAGKYQPVSPVPLNVCRHVLFLDQRDILALLPRSVTQNTNFHVNDPLPPHDSVTGYTLDQSNWRSARQGVDGLIQMIQNVFGRYSNDPQQLRAMLEQQRDQLPGSFPEGADDIDEDGLPEDHDEEVAPGADT
ncbi:DUF654-domain-containing protein [Hesseltinella vesiculosa]|uniref:DUF654-domain-containing protein n=1 Tax=Hesseltinella vesiculosa TaxID=101127 RepID=A0A1X2G4S7_9FUNG|nr:DUF654-domain-containing protein [Hesseltinella vesiculosa]